MESKIRVEHDFGTSQTWLQLYVSTSPRDGGQPDLRDLALKTFIEQATHSGNELCIQYPETNQDNSVVQVVVKPRGTELKWVGLNAKCLISTNANFKEGQSYNLLMATGEGHRVFVKGSGHIVRYNDECEYPYLADFVKAWDINDIGRFDLSEIKVSTTSTITTP